METYMNKLASTTTPSKEAVEIIIVTYSLDKKRLEKKFFLEEQEDGRVDLIMRRNGRPERMDLGGVAWNG